MQPITWSKEEFQANVTAKLALLRAHRAADRGLDLDQRLALAEDRTEFERVRQEAARQRMALIQSGSAGLIVMKADRSLIDIGKLEGCMLGRFDDGQEADKPARQRAAHQSRTDSFAASPSGESLLGRHADAHVKPDTAGARDSYATGFQLKPRMHEPFVPHAQRYQQAISNRGGGGHGNTIESQAKSLKPVIGFAADNLSADENFTEVPADRVRFRSADLYKEDDGVAQAAQLLDPEKEKRRRLVEQTKRQSSENWVVLDRATVLSVLVAHPAGITMVDLAVAILGEKASERDTRRLSALMRREEQRQTVATGGRSKPILITPAGFQALAALDVKQAAKEASERRLKRLESQRHRLLGEPNHAAIEKAAAKAAARATLLQARADRQAAQRVSKTSPSSATEPAGLAPRRYKLGKPLPPGKQMKPSGLAPASKTHQPVGAAKKIQKP